MNDFLLELSKNPKARRIVEGLGLPIPMPQVLLRSRGATEEQPLRDEAVALHGSKDSALLSALARTLVEAGANLHVDPELRDATELKSFGEAFGRPAQLIDPEASNRFRALVLDATRVRSRRDLDALLAFFPPLLGRLERCGRAVVVSAAGAPKNAEEAATQAALEGFIRSLAKELGRKGSTAQLLFVDPTIADRAAGPLRYFLSDRSAYVSGQVMRVVADARALRSPTSSWSSPLEGKVALVTGAARGIGAATAQALAADGAKVVCLDRPEDDGPTSRLAKEIGGSVLLVDVSDPAAGERIAKYLSDEHGGVDIVVHNAGVTRDKTLGKMTEDKWGQVLDINLAALVRITEALKTRVLQDEGRIICLSSIAGIAGNAGQTNYAASKSGVIGMVRYLAPALAPRGITVNAVAPGFIETRLTAAIPMAIREVGRRMNNLGQGGLPEDVAQAIAFLASPGAQGVTGQVLRVCGGSLIGA